MYVVAHSPAALLAKVAASLANTHDMQDKNHDEAARQNALNRLQIVDTPDEQAYDDITSLAATTCGAPIAMISLADNHRQWFKSRVGIQLRETPRENSFCSTALHSTDEIFIIEDASKDERFANHVYVVANPYIRFYAAVPLLTTDGYAIGTICVIDVVARTLTEKQFENLRFLAQQVMVMLESRVTVAQTTSANLPAC